MSKNSLVGTGQTELMQAVIDQDIELVTALIQSGANLEARDKLGQNVLYYAFPDSFSSRALEVLKLLISKGININSSMDGDGCSALVTAVVQDLVDVVDLLLENGVYLNDDAMSKETAALSSDPARQCNRLNESTVTSQFIFSKGCGHTITPLCCAVLYQRREIFDKLLKAKASLSELSYGTFWKSSVDSICSNCDVEITPLHMAAYLGDVNMTYTLIKSATGFYRDELETGESLMHSFNDITPLWFASLQGHESIVKLLLRLGRPVVYPCHFGSGLQVCLEKGHTNIAIMLLRAGYNLNHDLEWIEEKEYPTQDEEVIDRIESMLHQPRPLLDWCCESLRVKHGLYLDQYLSAMKAPNSLVNILNFNYASKSSWQSALECTNASTNITGTLNMVSTPNIPPISHLQT